MYKEIYEEASKQANDGNHNKSRSLKNHVEEKKRMDGKDVGRKEKK